MSIEGVDYSTARPKPTLLKQLGKQFVCRYLAHTPNPKVLSNPEKEALHAAGLMIVLNWEQAAGAMKGGRTVGIAHAKEALKQANALGAPADIPIYFSCDFDVTNQYDAVAAYLAGCASILGKSRVGVYGEYSIIERMVPNHAAWGWQTYAWSHGAVSDKAHLLQYKNGVTVAGGDCDLDRALKSSFGGWGKVKKRHPLGSLDGYSVALLEDGDNDAYYDGYDHVARLQALLKEVWKQDIAVDGVYGPATVKAVRLCVGPLTGTNGHHVHVREWAILYGLTVNG